MPPDLTKLTGFDWDQGNREKNADKHGVTFRECEEIFFNAPLLLMDDEKHPHLEGRHYVLGKTDAGRTLFVAFTVRRTLIRVISARDMSRKERTIYEKA